MENDKYLHEPIESDIFAHERQDEGELTPEELQERADEKREEMGEDSVRSETLERFKAECERDAKFAIDQFKMMQPLYDSLTPKIK